MRIKNIGIPISCVALIISVTSICSAIFVEPPHPYEYWGLLISVLSVIVTVLIGWQVYNIIDYNIARREIKALKPAMRAYVITLSTLDWERRNITEYAMERYINAIEEALRSGDDEVMEYPLSRIRAMIEKNKGEILIYEGRKRYYASVLKKTGEDVEDILNTIYRT